MPRTAAFDGQFHAPVGWRDIAFLELLKSRRDEYRKHRGKEAKYEDRDCEFEAEFQGLEAMAHWHDPRPTPCLRRRRRRHLLDDNPRSG
jgi:hypothetical protein